MQPLDYSIDVKSPFEQAVSGYQLGGAIQELQAKRLQAEQQRQLQMQFQQDMAALDSKKDPTARDFSSMMIKYPQMSEHLKRGFDILQPAQQSAKVNGAAQVYAAVNSGANDVAVKLLTDEATAYRNSGDEKAARDAETWAKMIEASPQTAKTSMGLMLSSVMGADKFASTFPALGKEGRDAEAAPAELARKIAEARKSQIDARFGEQKALGDLEKQGWDIKNIQSDIEIRGQNSRIAAMNADLARETNALRRQELQVKINEAIQKREEHVTDKAEKIESARFNMDNMLNTIDRIKINPKLNNVLGTIEGRLPAVLSDEAADAIQLIETLGSQAFLSQIPQIKGTGALSNAEGDKLQAAFQNFHRAQSETQFKANLAEAQRLILKARKNLVSSSGMPDTKPDRPTADNQPVPSYLKYK